MMSQEKQMTKDSVLKVENLTIRYGAKTAVNNVSIEFKKKQVTALIGPSGCGKSTLLRALNRMHDFLPEVSMDGSVRFNGTDLYGSNVDSAELRSKIGMVFQKPNPFPKTIFKNVTWGPKVNGFTGDEHELVEKSLRRAALWDEVKDRLNESALALSGGQQQRLCIARTIAMSPEVILMDEPCSALDPISTAAIEDLIMDLRNNYTIIIVTHNMQQAGRISDETYFLYQGKLIEGGPTKQIFTTPKVKKTEEYITGRFG